MSDIIGKKAKSIDIPVPIGKKIKGCITAVAESKMYEGTLSITIEFPDYKIWSDDGRRQFVKRAYYSMPINWGFNNKSGKLYEALEGHFPDQEGINWTQLLVNREVECIFEDFVDKNSGESRGQRIMWVGTSVKKEPKQDSVPNKTKPDDELAF